MPSWSECPSQGCLSGGIHGAPLPWCVPQESFTATSQYVVCERARVHVPVTGAGQQCMLEYVSVGGAQHVCLYWCVSVHGCTCDVHVCHYLCVCCCMSWCCSRHFARAVPSTPAPQHGRAQPQPPQAVRAVPGAGPRCPLDKTACPMPAEPPVPHQAGSLYCVWHSTQYVLPGAPAPRKTRGPPPSAQGCAGMAGKGGRTPLSMVGRTAAWGWGTWPLWGAAAGGGNCWAINLLAGPPRGRAAHDIYVGDLSAMQFNIPRPSRVCMCV